MIKNIFFILIAFFFSCKTNSCEQNKNNKKPKNKQTLIIPQKKDSLFDKIGDIPPPKGFERIKTDSNCFAFFLRNLTLSDDNTVYYYNGEEKYTQNLHFAVLEIDVGNRDLQQCADAVMRLRAEYLYAQKKYNKIHFNFLSDGKPRYYTNYAGNDRSYKKFRKYMNYIFAYANTLSLKREMQKIEISQMQIGDVFISIGNPYGHSIMVMDMAKNKNTGETIFMIAQSYMPAQSIHILKNLNNPLISPWYNINFGNVLKTPEWNFTKNDLYRFYE